MSANPYEAPTSELAAPELRATRRSHLKDRAKLLLLGLALCLVCLVFLVILLRSGLSLEWSFIALFAVQSALIILYASWKVRRRALHGE